MTNMGAEIMGDVTKMYGMKLHTSSQCEVNGSLTNTKERMA